MTDDYKVENEISEENPYAILVNQNNPCKDISHFEIIDVNSAYMENRYLEKNAFNMWKLFQEQARKDGFHIEIESGYRSKELQQSIWDELILKKGLEYTKKYVAKPGYSEHQTALAIDICLEESGVYFCDVEFIGHPIVKYIEKTAPNFGFILRYPKGKEEITGYNYEPWHIRFVGVDLAREISNNNLTLEEYHENLAKNKMVKR